MEKEHFTINATPKKRLFQSIIADYTFNTAICELIDNSVDNWKINTSKIDLNINIYFDILKQQIIISDNAGGVKKEDLYKLVSPGASSNSGSTEIIGIFGVGTKRAVVHLSEDIKIKTRFKKKETYELRYDKEWIENDDDWNIEARVSENIEPESTNVELNILRSLLTLEKIEELILHLGKIYYLFLNHEGLNIEIIINSSSGEKVRKINPIKLEDWSFNPKYKPQTFRTKLNYSNNKEVKIKIRVGFTKKSTASDEYGFNFFCNNRLVCFNCKDQELGYVKGLIGRPHNSISVVKIVVFLTGPSEAMPWNSSKTKIDYEHKIFKFLRSHLIDLAKSYSSIARSFGGQFTENLTKYSKGNLGKEIIIDDLGKIRNLEKPEIPPIKISYEKQVLEKNKKVFTEKPWTKGLTESVVVAKDILTKKNIDSRNRIVLILLDSTLEIAFKDYLLYKDEEVYGKKIESMTREDILKIMYNNAGIIQTDISKIRFYYNMRNDLIHKRASISPTDTQISDFEKLVKKIITKLFGVEFIKK